MLQVRNPGIIQEKERLKANALMMRGFSFAAMLYAILSLLQFLIHTDVIQYLIFCTLSLIIAVLTHKRSRRFDEWSYRVTYSQALAYGSNLKEFLENSIPEWKPEENFRSKKKKKERRLAIV